MSDTSGEAMAYLGIAPCGCTKMAYVDHPAAAKSIGKEIVECLRLGYTIKYVTVAYVREHWLSSCEQCKPAPAQKQEVMDL